ncbi:MAG: hypothetical protein V7637_1141 [Mycobacteriales bacterium]
MVGLSSRLPRVALIAAGVTAAGLVAAVGLTGPLGAHRAGAVAAPASAAAPASTVAPGTGWAWGFNNSSQGSAGDIADPTSSAVAIDHPKAVAGLPGNVIQVSGGFDDGYALLSDGTVRAWGVNTLGQFGNGTTSPGSTGTPANVLAQPSGLHGITQIAGGRDDAFAIGAGGIVFAWGDNISGQLGDGTTTRRLTPVHIGGLSGIQQIAAGQRATYALAGDGTVWSWGSGVELLGDGVTTQRLRPAKIPGLTGVTELATSSQNIATGLDFTLALRSDGTVWAWGNNAHGQIGINGTAATYPTPQKVLNLAAVQHIAAGLDHALALDRSGRVWSWGDGNDGELGDGTQATRTAPALVPTATGITQVAAGDGVSGALRSDGTVLAWGSNGGVVSYLGVDTLSQFVTTPRQVVERDSVTQLAIGGNTFFAVTAGQGESYGYVYADNASPALNTPYNPSTRYAFDSTGGRVAVTRTATGSYTVDFPGLAAQHFGGNVQVSAFGATANRCKVVSWLPSDTTLKVTVRCANQTGTLADTQFVAHYFHGGAPAHNEAYVWANQPTTTDSYSPEPAYNFNSTGTPNTVSLVGGQVGLYQIFIPGIVSMANVTVTAYGNDGDYCKVSEWLAPDVYVSCFTPAGTPANTMWTLHATNQSVGTNGHPGAYLTADQPAAPSYAPDPDFQWNSTGATNTVTRSTTGSYQVLIPGLAALSATNAIVTAERGNSSCSVNGWAASGTGTAVNVVCHNAAGNLADSEFTLSYLTNF